MWYRKDLANTFQIPLINADRMMLSILPESPLPKWAKDLRDNDATWMAVAQKGVETFTVLAMDKKASFAMETVFSHWKPLPCGGHESKIDKIRLLQNSGYFVLLLFVGLSNAGVSVGRVNTRHATGGHGVPVTKLLERFPRTQEAIREACKIVDASILIDNSRDEKNAFTVCRIEISKKIVFDCREGGTLPAPEILEWLGVVSPR